MAGAALRGEGRTDTEVGVRAEGGARKTPTRPAAGFARMSPIHDYRDT